MSALDVSVEPHPVTGEMQLVVDLGSGVRARLSMKNASVLQQRLWFALGEAEAGRTCLLSTAQEVGGSS